jgi:hypothetical protein
MTRTTMLLAALTAATLLPGCNDERSAGTPPAASTTAPAKETAAPATAAPAKETAATATATAAWSGPAKTYDCGAKGQKPCPMQGWMKTVMTAASSSDEGDKLAQALAYAARRPPPGYEQWTALAEAGAARARAGDVDGAKASCKRCHDLYKERYEHEMRDRPF